MAQKQHTRNGFIYFCTKFSIAGSWHHTWYFRPNDCRLEIECLSTDSNKVRKADVERFLDDKVAALACYNETIFRQGDVVEAQKRLDDAKLAVERTKSPDYDPGGSTNNPGKVRRAMRAPHENLREAEHQMEHALRVAEILAKGNR